MRKCRLLKPGLVEYGRAWELQKELFSERSQNKIIDTLLILQHPPTYTFGRRSLKHVIPAQAGIQNAGSGLDSHFRGNDGGSLFAIYQVKRGGGATYHGPGQIVAYPILGLKTYTTDFHTYLRMLEEVMIKTLTDFRIKSYRRPGFTGV